MAFKMLQFLMLDLSVDLPSSVYIHSAVMTEMICLAIPLRTDIAFIPPIHPRLKSMPVSALPRLIQFSREVAVLMVLWDDRTRIVLVILLDKTVSVG